MEEAEVPLERLHEQAHEMAKHSGHRWISWVALSTAILAVLAAIASLLSGEHASEAMMNQIEAQPFRCMRMATSMLGDPCLKINGRADVMSSRRSTKNVNPRHRIVPGGRVELPTKGL